MFTDDELDAIMALVCYTDSEDQKSAETLLSIVQKIDKHFGNRGPCNFTAFQYEASLLRYIN